MARLLHRSKSTKELRTKYELPEEELPRFSAQFPPHTPNKLTRRRAGTIVEPKQLSPSRSIADLKVTIRQGMVVASPLSLERNSSVASLGTSNRPTFPTTHELQMDSFPPRISSRVSLSSSPSTAGIGVAIGSPTKEVHMYIGVGGNTPEASGHAASTSIPAFYLPPEPFDIKGDTDLTGKQGNSRNGGHLEGRGGWRKLFGRSLFGSKKGLPPAPAPVPYVPVIEVPLQPRHIPLVAATAGESIPIVNKLKKEEQKERKVVDKTTKNQSSPQLLNVEIPTVEMERYSIMFRALLRDESPTKAQHTQKKTLYDRRRSKDVLSGGLSKERPKLQLEPLKRHATTGGRITPTPNIPDSPTPFSVPIKPNEAPPKQSVRLGRSNTTAALTRDPRPGPGFVLAGTTPDTDTIPSEALERRDPASIRSNLNTLQTGRDSMGSKGSGRSVALSVNGSFDEGDDCWFQEQVSGQALPTTADGMKNSTLCGESPVIKDSPKSSKSSLKQSPLKQSTPRQLSPKPISPKQTSPEQSLPRTEEELMIAAQESIQRQISISQRQLLLPVVRERAKPARVQTPPEYISATGISEQGES